MRNRVRFVSYDGKFPNLCSGTLILNVDGKNITFPDDCLSSGGYISFDKDDNANVTRGEWTILKFPEKFPVELQQKATDIVNKNIHFGCCGGCI